MEPDNAFQNSFSNVPSTPKKSESQQKKEDTPASKEQPVAIFPATPEQQPLPEEYEPVEAEKPVRKRGRRRKDDGGTDSATSNNAGHFSCICDKDLIAKVRAIAWMEHMTVRSVVESMFTKCIAKYEKKHGLIQIEQSHSSEELF